MIRLASFTSLCLVASIGAVAQEPVAPRDPASDAWLAFQAQHGPAWTAEWNKATRTPKAIYGKGLKIAQRVDGLDQARTLAGDMLDGHAVLLGRGRSRFVEVIGRKVGRVFVFVYDQQFDGLEVVGGRADVRLHDNGVVSMFGSKAVQIPAGFVTRAGIPMDMAWAIAHDHQRVRPEATSKPAGELVIWADVEAAQTMPRLAWRVQIDVRDGEALTVGKVFVDAATGEAFRFDDEVYHCAFGHTHVSGESGHVEPAGHVGREIARAKAGAGMAAITGNVSSWLNRGNPLTPLTNEPMQGLRVTAAGVGSAYTDANGDFTIPYAGTNPVSLTVNMGSGSGEYVGLIDADQGTALTASVTATPGVPAQIQLLSPTAPEFSWSQPTAFWHVDDIHRWVRSITGPIATNRINIAAVRTTVNIGSTCNAFYTNNTINFYATGGSCNMTGFSSVIYHEWGHGLDHAFGGISQTDGLSEGWGDIISIYRLDDPIVGRNFTTSGGYVRSALNTRTYPAGGGVHQQGETWMGFAWDLRNNLISSLGRAPGIARAEAIVVGSLVANATDQPDAVLEVFILDDDDGNLANGTPNYPALEAAALRRSLPYPRVQVGTIAHTPLVNSEDQLAPRIVRATVAPISGSFTQVELIYDVGAGAQRRAMVPTSAANEYLALTPGVLSPASVSYHLEARHSTGLTLRFPEAGELSYVVGDEQVFFFEDFESGGTGWTHGMVARQDDWQFGTPTGKFGSSQGVSWADPSAAYSGSNAFGNDLGIGPYNGAYQQSVDNWLRSPALDMTGRVGVKLGFKRWLTVEEAIYDQATIRVNGAQVWRNPANGHLVDTAWTDFELAIPAANNNPAVTLEWQLQTDGGLELGGWALDDVRLFSFQALPPPAIESTFTPAQVDLGAATTLAIQGAPSSPAAVLLSDSQGPLSIPGLPTLHIGSNFIALPIVLDATGAYSASLTITSNPSATGALFYGQTVGVSPGVIETSNKMVLLFGN